MTDAARAVLAARAAYGRLVATLAARTRDIAGAEDALADAFAAALATWPDRGVPDRPEAWLLTVARNRATDAARRAARAPVIGADALPEVEAMLHDPDAIPDDRLRLLFVCAHPAIDPAIHTPLMLQTVLGLEAAQVARAFLLPPAAMAQRLVRAKQKIRDTRIGFDLPGRSDMAGRLPAVLEAVYGAFAGAWLDTGAAELADEADYLAQLLARLLPHEPEVLGLAALIGFAVARQPARVDGAGAFVPLDRQDPMLWDARRIAAAAAQLARAQATGRPGRFQIEAAIQAVHADRRRTGQTDWRSILTLQDALQQMHPTLGGAVALAVALAEVAGPARALAHLDTLPAAAAGFAPAQAARAHVLARLGRADAAAAAYDAALALTAEPALRAFLAARRAALPRGHA